MSGIENPPEERLSQRLGVPYVYLEQYRAYVCANGVLFSEKEYVDGVAVPSEYQRRSTEGILYDYAYAKKTGRLREACDPVGTQAAVAAILATVGFVCAAVSTVHTAQYLVPYTGMVLSWAMSAAVTAYCTVALEASRLLMLSRKRIASGVTALLWAAVTLFSMTTTVAVFWDRFTASERQSAERGAGEESSRLSLSVLRSAEAALRSDIDFKRRDIEWRQEKDYATAQVRGELTALQEALQDNLREQQEILSATPAAAGEKGTEQMSVYAFVAHMTGTTEGTAEFCVSTLCALFINLISPLSVSASSALSGSRRRRE